MNIRKYEAYVRAVELGSLSKAAEQLGYTQSGISHMMQSLEEEVGFPLMVRTPSGIVPNSEGELLLPVIRQLPIIKPSLARKETAINITRRLVCSFQNLILLPLLFLFFRPYSFSPSLALQAAQGHSLRQLFLHADVKDQRGKHDQHQAGV